jgi:DtxR family Mn-dependent transcriptional regulator
MSSVSREDYLVNIHRLSGEDGTVRTSKLASVLGVAPASVTEMLRTLSEAGLVNYEKYKGVILTKEGLETAKNIRRKHNIVEKFLSDVLDIDCQAAHDEACLMEHAISEDSANKICRIIGTNVNDDCGTCSNPCNNQDNIRSVADMLPGDQAIISHLKYDDSSKVRKLLSMGFIPGREVVLDSMQNNGPRVVRIGDSIIAIDQDLSKLICLESNSDDF